MHTQMALPRDGTDWHQTATYFINAITLQNIQEGEGCNKSQD